MREPPGRRRWFAAAVQASVSSTGIGPTGRGGTPNPGAAERLIHLLTHPEIVRRFSDHPPMDFVQAAFAYALEEDVPQGELDKLSRWREEVREATPE